MSEITEVEAKTLELLYAMNKKLDELNETAKWFQERIQRMDQLQRQNFQAQYPRG
jgi:hypothetical protein